MADVLRHICQTLPNHTHAISRIRVSGSLTQRLYHHGETAEPEFNDSTVPLTLLRGGK